MLLDNIMPEMTGFELLAVLNQSGWISRVPAVMISSDNAGKQVLKGYALSVADFIGRPYSAAIVKKRVENLIGRLATFYSGKF